MSDRKLPTPMLSIEEQWKILHRVCFPAGTTQKQYRQLRQMFYAGYTVAFTTTLEISNEQPEDVSLKYMDARSDEIREFEAQLKADLGKEN